MLEGQIIGIDCSNGKDVTTISCAMSTDAYRKIKEKAAKWDMIQWAIDNAVDFVEFEVDENIYHTCLIAIEIDKLEQLYKEREQDAKVD